MSRTREHGTMLKFGVITCSYREHAWSFNAASMRSEWEWKDIAERELGAKSHIALVTCNRAELYFTYDGGKVQEGPILKKFPGALLDVAAVEHLFRVAAGLESMSVGENEIMYQLKTAYTKYAAAGAVDSLMSDAFTRAISFGKNVRENTHISRGKTSIPSIALGMTSKIVDLGASTVCIVGTGMMAETFLRYFKKIKAKKIIVIGRNAAAGRRLASAYAASFSGMPALDAAVAMSDVIFVATSAADLIIRKEMMPPVSGRKIFIDISNPKNVDPEISHLSGITLIGLDELDAIASKNASAKHIEILKAEKMLKESVKRFELSIKESPADKILSLSYTSITSVAAREAERMIKELKKGADPSTVSKDMASAIAKKVLGRYSTTVRVAAATGDEKLLQQLKGMFDQDA